MRNLFASMVVGLVAVVSTPVIAAPAVEETKLAGAGATFPAPLYKKWVAEFEKANPDIKIDYNSIGSGGGIKNLTDKTVAFGATDAPLNEKEIEALGGAAAVIQFPTCAGGIVPAYNLPGVTGTVNFTGEILADIFMGKINKWNDPKLTAINKDIKLPDLAITPAWRTDGSGTTYVFTNYLATQSEEFKSTIGAGKTVKFTIGQGGKGNEGVAAVVQQTAGAIGYTELNYATANKIAFGAVKNAAGQFIKATPESVSYAGEGAVDKLKGGVLKADIWNQKGEKAYPISAFTYIIFYTNLSNLSKASEAEALVKFLRWTVGDGQKLAGALDYAPLAPAVAAKSVEAIKMANFKGAPVAANK